MSATCPHPNPSWQRVRHLADQSKTRASDRAETHHTRSTRKYHSRAGDDLRYVTNTNAPSRSRSRRNCSLRTRYSSFFLDDLISSSIPPRTASRTRVRDESSPYIQHTQFSMSRPTRSRRSSWATNPFSLSRNGTSSGTCRSDIWTGCSRHSIPSGIGPLDQRNRVPAAEQAVGGHLTIFIPVRPPPFRESWLALRG
jgi:hypothetical protein